VPSASGMSAEDADSGEGGCTPVGRVITARGRFFYRAASCLCFFVIANQAIGNNWLSLQMSTVPKKMSFLSLTLT